MSKKNNYLVRVECFFDATSPEDAVAQMAAWLSTEAYCAGYRVLEEGGDSIFIDADDIDYEALDKENQDGND